MRIIVNTSRIADNSQQFGQPSAPIWNHGGAVYGGVCVLNGQIRDQIGRGILNRYCDETAVPTLAGMWCPASYLQTLLKALWRLFWPLVVQSAALSIHLPQV